MNIVEAPNGFDVTATIENFGNVFLRPEVWIDISDETGETVFTQQYDEKTLLPEREGNILFELRNLPIESGEYLVTVYADYGVQTLIAAQGRVNLNITPPEEPDEQPEETETEDETADAPAEDSA